MNRQDMIEAIAETVEDWELESLIEMARENYRRDLRKMDTKELKKMYDEEVGDGCVHI